MDPHDHGNTPSDGMHAANIGMPAEGAGSELRRARATSHQVASGLWSATNAAGTDAMARRQRGSPFADVTTVTTPVTTLLRWFGRGSAARTASAVVKRLAIDRTPEPRLWEVGLSALFCVLVRRVAVVKAGMVDVGSRRSWGPVTRHPTSRAGSEASRLSTLRHAKHDSMSRSSSPSSHLWC
jgi:hypothetical protein